MWQCSSSGMLHGRCPHYKPCHTALWQLHVCHWQVVSSTLAGAAVGSLTGSSLADNLGRRKAFLLDTIPLALGPLLSATATSLSAMIAGRLIAGVGIGLSSALVPLYISEVSSLELPASHGSCMPG